MEAISGHDPYSEEERGGDILVLYGGHKLRYKRMNALMSGPKSRVTSSCGESTTVSGAEFHAGG